jgi:hypothetical protein
MMTTPHKATERQWGIVRRRAEVVWNDDSTDSVLLEVADRVAALEGVLTSHGEQISGLHSQHNLVVDNITDLQGCVNQLEAAASPPFAADHSRGAPEMVATEDELLNAFHGNCIGGAPRLRAVYNLGRQHSAQSRQEREVVPVLWVRRKPGPGCNASVIAWLPSVGDLPIGEHILYAFPGASQPRQEDLLTQPAPLSSSIEAGIDRFGEWLAREMPPGTVIGDPLNWAPRIAIAVLNACQEVEPTPPPAPVTPGCGSTSKAVGFAAAPLLWVLWHHLGASSPVGQPIRRYLGMGQHDRMTPEGIEAAKRWARESMGVQDYLDSIPAYSSTAPEPAPPPTPDGGLLEEVARLLANRISTMRPSADCTPLACTVLCVVADAAEKMVPDPNLTWERVAIWLDMESKLEGRADG